MITTTTSCDMCGAAIEREERRPGVRDMTWPRRYYTLTHRVNDLAFTRHLCSLQCLRTFLAGFDERDEG